MKKVLLIILISVSVLILIGVIAQFLFGYSLNKRLEPKIDPTLYSEIVRVRVAQSDQYKFLPTDIPQNAVKVAFFHVPGFLQGGDVLALRLTLPPERIVSLLNELEISDRTEITSFEGIPTPYAYPSYDMKKPDSKNLFKGVSPLPDGFRVFLYKSDIEDIKKNWNHNVFSFTAVSINRKEVVYFVNIW